MGELQSGETVHDVEDQVGALRRRFPGLCLRLSLGPCLRLSRRDRPLRADRGCHRPRGEKRQQDEDRFGAREAREEAGRAYGGSPHRSHSLVLK